MAKADFQQSLRLIKMAASTIMARLEGLNLAIIQPFSMKQSGFGLKAPLLPVIGGYTPTFLAF